MPDLTERLGGIRNHTLCSWFPMLSTNPAQKPAPSRFPLHSTSSWPSCPNPTVCPPYPTARCSRLQPSRGMCWMHPLSHAPMHTTPPILSFSLWGSRLLTRAVKNQIFSSFSPCRAGPGQLYPAGKAAVSELHLKAYPQLSPRNGGGIHSDFIMPEPHAVLHLQGKV